MSPRILVAGIGNVFFRDDAFGVEVVNALSAFEIPSAATVRDFGIRGMHLAYEIVSGYDVVIFIDAVGRGEPPGTLFVIEPDVSSADTRTADAHSMELESVFAFVRRLGGSNARLFIVGCEPEDAGGGMGLTPSVAAAVPRAAQTVMKLIEEYVRSEAMV